MRPVFVSAVIALAMISAPPVLACKVAHIPAAEIAETIARSSAVFAGEVVAVADHPTDATLVRVQIRASKRFAGTVPDTRWYMHRKIRIDPNASDCAERPLEIGQFAIFFVTGRGTDAQISHERAIFDQAIVSEAAGLAAARR